MHKSTRFILGSMQNEIIVAKRERSNEREQRVIFEGMLNIARMTNDALKLAIERRDARIKELECELALMRARETREQVLVNPVWEFIQRSAWIMLEDISIIDATTLADKYSPEKSPW